MPSQLTFSFLVVYILLAKYTRLLTFPDQKKKKKRKPNLVPSFINELFSKHLISVIAFFKHNRKVQRDVYIFWSNCIRKNKNLWCCSGNGQKLSQFRSFSIASEDDTTLSGLDTRWSNKGKPVNQSYLLKP